MSPEKRRKEKFLRSYYAENPQASVRMGIDVTRQKFHTGISPQDASRVKREALNPKKFKHAANWKEVEDVKQENSVIDIRWLHKELTSKETPGEEEVEQQVYELADRISSLIQGTNIKSVIINETETSLAVMSLQHKKRRRASEQSEKPAQVAQS